MDALFQDEFVVYVRDLKPAQPGWQNRERELVHCATYEEAEWVRHEMESPRRRCIIRYVGPTGGGD